MRTTMKRLTSLLSLGAVLALAACTTAPPSAPSGPMGPGVVKVTPLGGFDGEFCAQDRALVFEDPNGTRVLYEPRRSVAGANDTRLRKITVILVSHTHGGHLGNAHTSAVNAGECGKPDFSVS